jgi:hypothetical protein
MNLKEFTVLVRKVARIIPTLATDEEIATIFELAQDEQNQTKAGKQGRKQPDKGSELWSRRAKPSRQSLLPRERDRRDDVAGFVTGLEIAQLINDLLGDSDILIQQAPAFAPPEASRKGKQRKPQKHSHLTETAQHEDQDQPKLVNASTSRLPARCLSAAAPLHSNHSMLQLVTSSSAGVVHERGPYSPSLDVGSFFSTRALQLQQHDTNFADDAGTTVEQTRMVGRPTSAPDASPKTAQAELTLNLEEAAKRLLTEQLEISGNDPTFNYSRSVGKSSMDLPHDLTPPSRTTSAGSPQLQAAAEGQSPDRLVLPHGITPPSSPSPRKDAAGASGAMSMTAIGEESEVAESAELDRVLEESASWLMQTEAAHLHLAH